MISHEVFIYIHQGCFAGTGAIVRLPQCQRSKSGGYGKISQCIITTKLSKAKTVCIFLGIYCISMDETMVRSTFTIALGEGLNVKLMLVLVVGNTLLWNLNTLPITISVIALENIGCKAAKICFLARNYISVNVCIELVACLAAIVSCMSVIYNGQ